MLFRTSLRLLLPGLVVLSGLAQPAPKLTSISREWIQRGTKARLSLAGENLSGLKEVLVSGAPGVKGEILVPEEVRVGIESSDGGISSVVRPDGKKAQVTMEIAADAALTEREVRVVSIHGVSNPLILRVSPYPEIDSANNQTRESAQKIEMPVAINGAIQSATESDFFLLTGKKGSHIITEVFAARLGSRLDSSVAIHDKTGHELARNEDAEGLDSVLDFAVPEDGEYLLEIRDFRYQGGGDYKYRMIVGVLPHVRRVFPFGGQRGQTVDLTLEGSNLDSSRLTLSLAPDAALGRQEIRTSTKAGLSNPFPFVLSDLPDRSESEPNSALDQADRIQIPVALNGKIGSKKDYDAFRFGVSADQRVIFDVSAYRFGSRLDALLTLTDASGKVLQRNDDTSGEDARIDYTFKDAGDYFIIIEDLLGRGGEDYGYRLTVERPQPDFSITVVRDVQRLHQGGQVAIRCEVNRMNGFNEPVVVSCENLPAGVYADLLLLPADVGAGFLMLKAGEDAALGSFPLKIRGSASRRVREAEVLNNDRPSRQGFLSVLHAAPFHLFASSLMASVEQNQSGEVDVLVERRNGYQGEIKISAEGFSAGRDPITKSFDVPPLVLKGGETRGKISLKAKTDSEIGVRPVVLRAEAEVGIVEYSSALPVATTQIPFVLSTSLKKLIVTAVAASTGSAAAEAAFNAKVERRDGYEGEIELKLSGLPDGVTLSLTNIAAKANESAIKLVATEKAPTGTNVQLTLTAVGQHKDRIYRFQAPPLTLTINAPEAEEKAEPRLANQP